MTLPNSRERQIMQRLKCGLGQSHEYAGQPKDDCKMISKGSVEMHQTKGGSAYRLTEPGLQAMKAPLPVQELSRPG